MREKNVRALRSNMDILISRMGMFVPFEFKNNLTVSTVWNAGEINTWMKSLIFEEFHENHWISWIDMNSHIVKGMLSPANKYTAAVSHGKEHSCRT